jgi:hypothetical protein
MFRFKQKSVHKKLDLILERLQKMSTQLDALTAAVNAEATVEASAVTLIQGLAAEVAAVSAQLAAAGTDTTALDALTAKIKASSDALSAAVAANTAAPTA